MQPFSPQLVLCRCCFHVQFLTLIDQRINYIELPARFQLCSQKAENLAKFRLIAHGGDYFPPVARHLIDNRNIQVAVNSHGQRARDRCSCHHQHVRCWFARRQSGPLSDTELVLLINYNETKI